jgi:hypothetical protein
MIIHWLFNKISIWKLEITWEIQSLREKCYTDLASFHGKQCFRNNTVHLPGLKILLMFCTLSQNQLWYYSSVLQKVFNLCLLQLIRNCKVNWAFFYYKSFKWLLSQIYHVTTTLFCTGTAESMRLWGQMSPPSGSLLSTILARYNRLFIKWLLILKT